MAELNNSVPECQKLCQKTDQCIGFRIKVANVESHSCHLKKHIQKDHRTRDLSGPRKCDPGKK